MSWLTSYCPRCQGMLIVPATFVGHSIICDKCGVTFIAMAQPQYMAPPQSLAPPMQLPPQLPYPAPIPPVPQANAPPMTFGYGAPPYPSPAGYSGAQDNAPPAPNPFAMPPSSTFPVGSLPGGADRPPSAPHPFGNPLPEIEILPPPQAKRRSSRRRSGEGKRTRSRSSGGAVSASRMPPPLPLPAALAEGVAAPSAAAPADHGPSGELGEIEQRIRRAQLRRTLSLAFAVAGLLGMTIIGLLVMKFVRPGAASQSDVPSVPAVESAPVDSAPSGEAETHGVPAVPSN